MYFYEWARKWRISSEAVNDLLKIINIHTVKNNSDFLSEGAIQNNIRLEASKKGCRLWRNNLGAVYTQDGTFLRYGLANETKSANKQIKSADLIGIRPVTITYEMVGLIIGQFLSREIKASDWEYRGTEREQAQLRWAELIISLGGDACFANREGTI